MPLEALPSFLRPLWARIALFAGVGGWGMFELSLGNTIWALLFLAFAAYGVWAFIVQPMRRPPDSGA